MKTVERFFDTNLLLYLYSSDSAKADQVEVLLSEGGTVSAQVLNEFASVAIRKLQMSFDEVRETLSAITEVCSVIPLTLETHSAGLRIAERFRFSVYDSLIVAAALQAGCKTLLTEDLQHGQSIDQRLVIRNPFRA